MPRLGLIVNPIAGMGGRVGLKGTDGRETFEKAKKLGAKPVAPVRAKKMLKTLKSFNDSFLLMTYPCEMGEYESKECGYDPTVLGSVVTGETTALDTNRAAKDLIREKVDLILFVGGDGTALDVYNAVETKVPILGAPAGVKIFSAVFANTPEDAGRLAARFLRGDLPVYEAEVMDVDEVAFRQNRLKSELKGYSLTPYEPSLRQSFKMSSGTTGNESFDKKAIAKCIAEALVNDRVYILGPGTTTREVAKVLGIENSTLLGVDLIKNKRLLAMDVGERQILKELEEAPGTIIVSPIGKQGFIFGRGNQQISSKVIKRVGRDNIIVVATPTKLEHTPRLKVDTGDIEIDRELRGDIPVIVAYWLKRTIPIV